MATNVHPLPAITPAIPAGDNHQSVATDQVSGAARGQLERRKRATVPSDPFLYVLPRDAEVEPDPRQLRLDFHRESTIGYDHAGGQVKVALVSALDVAHALASELDLTTGILPPDTFWLAKTGTGTRLALWVPPQVRTVRLREAILLKGARSCARSLRRGRVLRHQAHLRPPRVQHHGRDGPRADPSTTTASSPPPRPQPPSRPSYPTTPPCEML